MFLTNQTTLIKVNQGLVIASCSKNLMLMNLYNIESSGTSIDFGDNTDGVFKTYVSDGLSRTVLDDGSLSYKINKDKKYKRYKQVISHFF